MKLKANENNFNKGAFLLSRSLFESDIWFMPPEYLKTWIYLIGKANHQGKKYNGYYCDRGQYFCDYNELREQLEHKIGYRKKKFNENHMKNLMKHLREAGRITSTKKPRGVLITILNYDDYQNLTNYEKTNEKTNEKTICKPDVNQKPPSINKNDKELKKYTFSPNSDEFRLASLLYDLILEKNPTHKKPDLQKWAKHIDLMIRCDNRTPEQVKTMIRWCQQDIDTSGAKWKGWASVILSSAKLREKFDDLTTKMNSEKNNSDVNSIENVAAYNEYNPGVNT